MAMPILSRLQELGLEHRVVMAPLTRIRGSATMAATAMNVEYYAQRASDGGLVITEGAPISPETPYELAIGIYTEEQVAGWTKVVQAVHAKGGKISVQLWHLGRMSHEAWAEYPFLKGLKKPLPSVSSSAVAPQHSFARDSEGKKVAFDKPPRALTVEELEGRLVDDYRQAAKNALRCGFDFVEIHAAHGYLIDQFFCDGVNGRSDKFGTQSLENRTRLLGLVLDAVIEVMGKKRTAIRISPTYPDSWAYNSCYDSDSVNLYKSIITWLNKFDLGYLLITEPRWNGGKQNNDLRSDQTFKLPIRNGWVKSVYKGIVIGSSSFTIEEANRAIRENIYDAIAFGRLFISNPDLPDRIRKGSKLNLYDVTTFYSKGPKGYTDYPSLNDPNADSFPQIQSAEIGTTTTTESNSKSAKSKL